MVDIGLKVVGVGSVGTRCWILLLEGRDRNDPLFLQMKEATRSVLAEHLPARTAVVFVTAFANNGGYASQMVMQANGRKETRKMSGRFTTQNGTLTITFQDGTKGTHRYGFKNGKLWVQLASIDSVLYFDRAKT